MKARNILINMISTIFILSCGNGQSDTGSTYSNDLQSEIVVKDDGLIINGYYGAWTVKVDPKYEKIIENNITGDDKYTLKPFPGLLTRYRFFNKNTRAKFDDAFGDMVPYPQTIAFSEAISDFLIDPKKSKSRSIPEIIYYYQNEQHLEHILNGLVFKKIKDDAVIGLINSTNRRPLEVKETVVSDKKYFYRKEEIYQEVPFKISKVTHFLQGRVFKTAIIKEENSRKQKSYDIIHLDPTGTANLYIKGRKVVDSLVSELFVSETVIDPIDGNTISKYEYSTDLINLKKDLVPYNPHSEAEVLFCDSGTSSIPGKNVLVGPYDKSFYGWYKDPKSIGETLSGLFINDNIGAHLNLIIQDNFEFTNLISATFTECFNNSMLKEVKKHGVKFVNLSIAHHAEKKICDGLGYSEVINKNKDLLWVFGAGNNGQYLNDSNNYICPQNLVSGNANAIVVGIENWEYSNHGSFIDLNTTDKSTSHAAVRISNLLVKLHRIAVNLSHDELKKIVILSSDYKRNSTRSNGVLNEKRAIEFLDLVVNENYSLKEAFDERGDHECSWYYHDRCIEKELNRFEQYKWEEL